MPGPDKVKVILLRVNGSIASLNTTVGFILRATPVAELAGTVELTVGAVISGAAPVVNDQTLALAKALWAKSVTPVEIVTVNSVFAARVLNGLNVAVVPT